MDDYSMFVGIFLALSLVFLTSLYFKYRKKLYRQDHGDNCECPVHGKSQNTTNQVNPPNATKLDIHLLARTVENNDDDAVIEQAFGIASQLVQSTIKHVSNDIKLALYGLYKQSMSGDCDQDEPSQLSMTDHAKWSAWTAVKGLDQMAAKKKYFLLAYKEIVVAFKLEIKLFSNPEDVPAHLKQHAVSTDQSANFNFNVQSKERNEKFDEQLHGDKDELFNRFDLTTGDVDIDAIRSFIVESKPDLNKQNENGMTFMSFAVDNGHLELVKVLIEEFAANVNVRDDMGYTPLHSAAMSGNKEMVSLLLSHGADRKAKSTDDDEETPLDLAEDEEIKALLQD